MALPVLNTPKFKLKLPSDNRVVNFRPFLVKEEKILLIATETGEQAELITAIKNIIKACTDIKDVEHLSTFDIEYVFLQIRTKSVGESVEVQVTCPDDGETQVPVSIPLDQIKIHKTKGHKKEIKLSEEIVLTMKYPSLDVFVEMNFQENEGGVDQVFKMAAGCIESIADTEQVYECKDLPKEELNAFLDQMTSDQFKKVQDFFESMPKLQHTLKVTNPNTKVESEVKLEGLASFFG